MGAAGSGRRTQHSWKRFRIAPLHHRHKLHARHPERGGQFPLRATAIRRQRHRSATPTWLRTSDRGTSPPSTTSPRCGTPGIDGTGQTIAIAGTSAIDIGEIQHVRRSAPTATTTSPPSAPSSICPPATPGTRPSQGSSGNSKPSQVCTTRPGPCPAASTICLKTRSTSSGRDPSPRTRRSCSSPAYPHSATDDNLYDSESYIVDNVGNSSSPVYGVHVMNVSYGECELGLAPRATCSTTICGRRPPLKASRSLSPRATPARQAATMAAT